MLGNLEFNSYTHGPDQLIPVFAVIDICRNGKRVEKRIDEQVIYCMLHSNDVAIEISSFVAAEPYFSAS